jgi:DNA invertase Pin-like site-specific DNA recombinase
MKESCWILSVVSSNPQETSLAQQTSWARKTAKTNGWTVGRVFEGVASGKRGTRKLLDDLIAELRELPKVQRPTWLCTVRIDRLGRGTSLETMGALAELRSLGVRLFTREDGAVSVERASEAILPSIRAIVSALEGETRADRTRAGVSRRRSAGKHVGALPYGVVTLDGKAVAHAPEVEIVREIFELAASGWGLERIAAHIYRKGPPPKTMPNGSTRTPPWKQATIRGILKSTTIRDVVVDPNLAARVDTARTSSASRYCRRMRVWEWPLRGAVQCTCGFYLVGHSSGAARRRVRYYHCQSHPHSERTAGNGKPWHRADALEASFVNLLERLKADPSIKLRRSPKRGEEQRKTREASLRRQIEKLEQRRHRACELAEDDGYTGKELRERLDRIDAERRTIAGRLEEISTEARQLAAEGAAETRLVDVLLRLPTAWPRLPIEGRQTVAKALAVHLHGLFADPARPGRLFRRKDACRKGLRERDHAHAAEVSA